MTQIHLHTYLLTYSFPCTDLSVAGKQAGMSKGSGTRSGLLWEVERILTEIRDSNGELPLNGEVLQQIDSAPDSFFVERLHWDAEKEDYIARLKELFINYGATEDNTSSLNSIMLAMQNWYRSLPRYSRELNLSLHGNDTLGASKRFMNVLRNQNNPRDILFKHFPQIFCTLRKVSN